MDYLNATLGELAKACADLSFELRKRKPRTREERRALAETAVGLLFAVSRWLGQWSEHYPYTPEFEAKAGPVARSFLSYYERETRRLRAVTLGRAAQLALGMGAMRWMEYREPGGRSRHDVVLESEADLTRLLDALDAVRTAKNKPC